MRPLELTLRSFRSFSDATIDFRGSRIVVVSGDTGAGKTSILDGICFALFARTPELAGSRDLVSLGADNGEVRLDFHAGGHVWRVTRRIGRNAPEPAHLLERIDNDGSVTDRVSGAAAVNDRIPRLIGMTFAAFTSAVLLAQGRFAQFLQSRPRERDVILRELFGVVSLDAARTAAVTFRDGAEREAETLDRERAKLRPHHPGMRNARAAAVRAAAARRAQLEALEPIVAAVTQARRDEREATARSTTIRVALTEVPTEADRLALVTAYQNAERTAKEAAEVRDDAQRSLDDALSARDGLRESHGGTAAELAALRGLAERAAIARQAIPREERALAERERALTHRRATLNDLRRSVEAAQATATQAADAAQALREYHVAHATACDVDIARQAATAARAAAAESARVATDEANLADAALDELRHAHLAASIRARLTPGDPCPVCGNAVHDISLSPEEDLGSVEDGVVVLRERAERAANDLTACELERRSAENAHAAACNVRDEVARRLTALGVPVDTTPQVLAHREEEARVRLTAVQEPQAQAATLATEVERESGSVDEARRRLDRDRADLIDLNTRLGARSQLLDPAATLGTAIRELEMLEQSVASSGRYGAQATARAAEAERVLATIERGELAPMRQALAVVATRLDADPVPADLSPAQLHDAATLLVATAEAAAREAEARAATARRDADESGRRLGETGTPLGVTSAEGFDAIRRSAVDSMRSARHDRDEVERLAAVGRRLSADALAARREAELYAIVAVDLQANRFPRHLLSRFHERLATDASTRLHTLSHGAFTFVGTDPDPLAVIDHRRGRRSRSAATLSGGERFLASLALALSLSDIAAGADGRLDCLFLDEGFSTLDDESLEVAISGVEQMADDGRLVVVITHLPGVAERLGSAIYVEKDPATGISRVRTAAR